MCEFVFEFSCDQKIHHSGLVVKNGLFSLKSDFKSYGLFDRQAHPISKI